MIRPGDYLNDPRLNKGTAFTEAERERLGLSGLLPPRVVSPADQQARIMENFRSKPSALEQYIYLVSLQDRNEHLFYQVLMDHIEEMLPVIYTPTVGEACLQFGHIFRRPRGLYLSVRDRGRVQEILRHWPEVAVGIIVVTDGERILGLGDLGANGMGIPIGKLSLYTACAGVDPALCLPLTLDVGTDRESLRNDPLYLGHPVPRIRGEAYDALVDEMVQGVQAVFPGALIQFEDFATANALSLLKRYGPRVCCFNDDIQGTAAVTLAGILSACRISGESLATQRLVFLGAGAAATGIANLVVAALMQEGLTLADARARIALVDRHGLVTRVEPGLSSYLEPYAHAGPARGSLLETVEALRPTILIGVSGQQGGFTEPVIRAMSRLNRRPVILALSNPTSCSECTAEEAYGWSEGRAIFASGSPFPPLTLGGKRHHPSQSNNAYVFPGLGLGVMLASAKLVTESMFYAAARTLASLVSEDALARGQLLPPLREIRRVSAAIATAVIRVAQQEGLARSTLAEPLEELVAQRIYNARYPDYA